ncbi:HK97 gp10 family phage protein [Escherichia coli]|uniref:HK97 gp10 family phage protein n=1 Tax=Escherichia coli TaxID=562 RepID=UPI000B7C9920|nr:HK97 gp10 family phage protein [Escherichia coli]EEY4012824.1 hypothetical protein [Escherichia coli]EFD5475582.1 hypothetical protein [Escherichia coli]EFI3648382.1 hypothetical protein [Escherichia coli]EFM0094984.1 hypothetical protein [Escherichia coli]EFM6255073.1 hypothetical protein [Escherichia coli]
MSSPVTFDLDGFDDLERQLQGLEIMAQKRVLTKVARESAQPLLPKMISNFEANWHSESGQLVNSFAIRVTTPKNATFADVFASVGVFKNRRLLDESGKSIDAPVYAYWLETGVEPHSLAASARRKTKKNSGGQSQGNKHPGISAKPFIRPAFDSDVEKMLGTEKRLLGELIDKELQRYARGAKKNAR